MPLKQGTETDKEQTIERIFTIKKMPLKQGTETRFVALRKTISASI